MLLRHKMRFQLVHIALEKEIRAKRLLIGLRGHEERRFVVKLRSRKMFVSQFFNFCIDNLEECITIRDTEIFCPDKNLKILSQTTGL